MDLLLWITAPSASRRPRNHPRPRSLALLLESLEERLALDGSGLPVAIGAATVLENNVYTLQLDAAGRQVSQWTIDWGDGTVEMAAGTATSITHVYADGPANFTITASATEVAPTNVVRWDPATGGNGNFFGLTDLTGSWTQAEAEAVAKGGHLVSITSPEEQAFVVNTFLPNNSRNIFWLGLNDAAVEGTFVWSDGSPLSITRWQNGEPNNFSNNEDYVTINWHFGNRAGGGVLGTWNDVPLNGTNLSVTAAQPYRGIMEFTSDVGLGRETVTTLQVEVQNVAPEAQLIGDTSPIVRGEERSFTLQAQDVSPVDQDAGFTFRLDWNGDGVVDEEVTGPDGTVVSHRFAEAGEFTARLVAVDKDGGTSAEATLGLQVVIAALRANPADATQTTLVVGGTDGNDQILLLPGADGTARLIVNGEQLGSFAPTQGAVISGYDGNDLILTLSNVSTIALGGKGNDFLVGGRGVDVLSGGEGNDFLLAGGGRDILIGGAGQDALIGDFDGNDLFVSGGLSFGEDVAALASVRAEWTSSRSQAVRLQNLRDGTGSADRLNGDVFLNSDTLIGDDVVDLVFALNRRGNGLFLN